MMVVTHIPMLAAWVRKNVLTAIVAMLILMVVYGGYEFVGGYADKFGSTFAGEYDSFKHSVNSYTIVDVLLQKYLVEYKASRIGIARFHDNVKDVGNNRLFYVLYESLVTQPGVTSNMGELRDLPIATFSLPLPTLLQGKPYFVWFKDVPESTLKDLLRKRGVKAIIFVPINDLRGRLVGMLTASWIIESDIPSEAERIVMARTLTTAADKVGAYLSGRGE